MCQVHLDNSVFCNYCHVYYCDVVFTMYYSSISTGMIDHLTVAHSAFKPPIEDLRHLCRKKDVAHDHMLALGCVCAILGFAQLFGHLITIVSTNEMF